MIKEKGMHKFFFFTLFSISLRFFIIFVFLLLSLSCASKGIKGLKPPNLKIKEIRFDENSNLIFSVSDLKEILICPVSVKDFGFSDECKSIEVNSLFSTYSFEISKPKNYLQIKILLIGFGGERKIFVVDFSEKKIIEDLEK